jgi:hypothetical protein
MQHGACIGLMAIVAVACAMGMGLPATDAAEQVVEYHQADRSVAQALTAPTYDSTIDEARQ